MIRTIEELAMNAWPTHKTVNYDGWILRFAEGYTRRANSVNPLYSSNLPVEEKIEFCEQLYQAKGIEIAYKMTTSCLPKDLDAHLERRGYRITAQTNIDILDLSGWDAPEEADICESLTAEWLDAFCQMSNTSPEDKKSSQKILELIVPRTAYAALWQENQLVACGLGVLQNGYLGFFDIIVDEKHRRKSLGQKIMKGITSWGKQNGAQTGYLQVMQNNPAALRLYSNLGFKKLYEYWYRVKPED
ncbi:MAG: GNAT family N-acetyltransferase [Anaerolineales bacterium]|nr:GNAT family N-acetyltransferase [Anaerolineales bacterium]